MKASMGMGWLFPLCCHFLLFHFSFSHSFCHPHDNLALLHFKASLTIHTYYSDYPTITTWKNGTDCCSWSGVTCDTISGHVTAIDLAYGGLQGKINANSTLFSLSHMQSLNLAFNDFSNSNIPSSIGEFVNLTHLNLSSSNFEGEIPPQISHLSKLQSLDLSLPEYHKLKWKEGTWKRMLQNVTELKVLVLSYTDLSSTSMSSLNLSSSLITLSLQRTGLKGKLTDDILCLPNLKHLDLEMNRLNGTLPNTFPKNSLMTSLNLNDNRLEGPLPESLSNCMRLKVLNLGNNQIEDTFPHSLRTLPYLKMLVLRANKLHGPIAIFKTKHGFPSLNIFYISSNNFSGPIPEDYIQSFESMKNIVQDEVVGNPQQYVESPSFFETYYSPTTVTTKATSLVFKKIPTNFISIDLSGNKFEGEIPNVIGELQALIGLNLSHNRLSGPIPQSMGNLVNLESLDLSSNMLTGRIPTELVNMNFLEVLNLSYNNLVGEIPQGKQFGSFLSDSYEGNLALCGVPLSVKCGEEHDQHSSQTLWREEKFGFGWEAVAIGYGCGMVFGVVMGSFVFLIGKPEFLVRMFGG